MLDADEDGDAEAQGPSSEVKSFLSQFENTTGLDVDGDGQVGSSKSRPLSSLRQGPASDRESPLLSSGSNNEGKVSPITLGGRSPVNLGKSQNPSAAGSPGSESGSKPSLLRSMTGFAKTDLKQLQGDTKREMGLDLMSTDYEKHFGDESDSDEEGESGKKEPIEIFAPVYDGPTAAETLAEAAQENFNRHDESSAADKFQRMRESAQEKVDAVEDKSEMLDKNRAMKVFNEILDLAIEQMASEDWRVRKVASYDFMDEIIVQVKKCKEKGDAEALRRYCNMVTTHMIPMFSDDSWWVRKAAIHGVIKLSVEDSAAQNVVVQSIPEGSNYKGRWTACRAAVRIFDMAASADKAEDSMRVTIRDAMLQVLADDHWMVRQEAINAMKRFAHFRDFHVISRAVRLLPHKEAKVRQAAVTILNNFIDTDSKHDAMTNKQVAGKMMESGLVDRESFEALDDNGNGRLSAKELRMGLKDMINVIFSIPRIKMFLGQLANKDIRHQEFMDHVQMRLAEDQPDSEPPEDFYEERKALDRAAREARMKDFKKNGKRIMGDIVHDMISSLPVDYNLSPWVTNSLELALRSERDWICKDRLFEGYAKMVAMHDPNLPVVLCELLLDKHNSGKLCTLVAKLLFEVADIMGDKYMRKGRVSVFSHDIVETGGLKTSQTCIDEISWDICAVMIEKLHNPNEDMQLAAAQALIRFWDKGEETKKLQAEADEIMVTIEKKENLCNVAKEQHRESLTVGQSSNLAVLKRNASKSLEVKTLRDDEYPPEIQAKMETIKQLYANHEAKLEKVKASAKLDKSILDGLKNARKSKNVELQDIATKALEIFLKDSAASKARRGLKNAVKMVQVMARGPDL